MPVYTMNTGKLLVINEDKSRGCTWEYPVDMKTGEMLDKIKELEVQVKKVDEEQKKPAEQEAKPEPEQKAEVKPEEKPEA